MPQQASTRETGTANLGESGKNHSTSNKVPEVIAFSFAAGVDPQVGLF